MTQDPTTATRPPEEVVYLATLQFADGGLFDGTPTDNLAHAIRGTRRGTPGPTLCGIARFITSGPGWSVGGGISGPGITITACPGCAEVAQRDFPGVPVAGMTSMSGPLAEAIGVRAYNHSSGALKATDAPTGGTTP